MSNNQSIIRQIPKGIWVLGFVSMLMDISSEMIHSLLPLLKTGRQRKSCNIAHNRSVCVAGSRSTPFYLQNLVKLMPVYVGIDLDP